MNEDSEDRVYLLGIGGIGMSALARYFNHQGKKVFGYDKTKTNLTSTLLNEGINIIYEDDPSQIPWPINRVVYTPAIPDDLELKKCFLSKGFDLEKRAKVLGEIANDNFNIAVAGTHGKTSVSSMIAHLLHNGGKTCHAFIGGICKNYNSNWLHGDEDIAVVEADEFDASFLSLKPDIAVITAIDSDHLDIYGDHNKLHEAFEEFASNVHNGGSLFVKDGLNISNNEACISYSYNKGDCFAQNINFKFDQSHIPCFHFDLIIKGEIIKGASIHMPGNHNIENAVVAAAIALEMGLDSTAIKNGLSSFKGIKRRFEFHTYTDPVFIDDYAHHPEEIKVTLDALRTLYPNKKLTGIFQPHLYSRTKDFHDDFAKQLSALDELILLDIYPAREEPIEGVSSELIFNKLEIKNKKMCKLEQLPGLIKSMKNNIEVLITMGAGDIEKQIPEIKKIFVK